MVHDQKQFLTQTCINCASSQTSTMKHVIMEPDKRSGTWHGTGSPAPTHHRSMTAARWTWNERRSASHAHHTWENGITVMKSVTLTSGTSGKACGTESPLQRRHDLCSHIRPPQEWYLHLPHGLLVPKEGGAADSLMWQGGGCHSSGCVDHACAVSRHVPRHADA